MGEDRVERLYRDSRQDALRYAYAFTRNAATAEDLVQDSFLKLVRLNGSMQDVSNPRSYLLMVVRSACIDDHRRKIVPLQAFDGVLEEKCVVQPSQESVELAEIMENAFMRVPAAYLDFFLERQSGMSYDEIAAKHGTTKHIAMVRCCRARKKLQELLADVACA
jgi:RNA polymerase sigma-70 factor (ECF subfamily)